MPITKGVVELKGKKAKKLNKTNMRGNDKQRFLYVAFSRHTCNRKSGKDNL